VRRLRGDRGQVGGIEAVPFGLLVLVVGILLVAHTWAVVDAKFLTAAAAREATRAWVEDDGADARDAAERAVDGRPLAALTRTGELRRCATARWSADIVVPAFGVPWRDERPQVTVRSVHTEVVDPYRDGLPGLADCR
jgi:hypothetical protein